MPAAASARSIAAVLKGSVVNATDRTTDSCGVPPSTPGGGSDGRNPATRSASATSRTASGIGAISVFHGEHGGDALRQVLATDLHNLHPAQRQPIPQPLRGRARPRQRQDGQASGGNHAGGPRPAGSFRGGGLALPQADARAGDVRLKPARRVERSHSFFDPPALVRVVTVRHNVSRSPSGTPVWHGSAACLPRRG